MPRKPSPRCVRRYTCTCSVPTPVTTVAVGYNMFKNKPVIKTPACLWCGRPMTFRDASYQALLSPEWDSQVMRDRVRVMFRAMVAWR